MSMHIARRLWAVLMCQHEGVRLVSAALSPIHQGCDGPDAARRTWAEACTDWALLQQLVGCSGDQLCMLVHCALEAVAGLPAPELGSADGRMAAEAAFTTAIQPLLQAQAETIASYAAAHTTPGSGPEPLLQVAQELGQAHEAAWKPRLMRTVAHPSVAGLRQRFASELGAAERYPLLAALLSPAMPQTMVCSQPKPWAVARSARPHAGSQAGRQAALLTVRCGASSADGSPTARR